MPNDVTMHFIGSLQSRKVKEVINEIDYLHALDRLSLAKEINKRADHEIACSYKSMSQEKNLSMVLL